MIEIEQAIEIMTKYEAACKHRMLNGPIGPDPLYDTYVDRYSAFGVALTALREQAERETGCEHTIHTPSEEGYPDVKGRFYKCSCGARYIDTEQAQEWIYCPHCGLQIRLKEQLKCIDCKHSYWDEDERYCGQCCGKHEWDIVTDADFNGCKRYEPKEIT